MTINQRRFIPNLRNILTIGLDLNLRNILTIGLDLNVDVICT